MSKESSTAIIDKASKDAQHNGIINAEWAKGWKQVKPMSPAFQYRGTNYVFKNLTEKDMERILSYNKNPWFIRDEKKD